MFIFYRYQFRVAVALSISWWRPRFIYFTPSIPTLKIRLTHASHARPRDSRTTEHMYEHLLYRARYATKYPAIVFLVVERSHAIDRESAPVKR